MNRRNTAIARLRTATGLLAEQITEAIMDADDLGNRFGADVEQILDLGDRLHRLNVILAELPPEPEPIPVRSVFVDHSGRVVEEVQSPRVTLHTYLEQIALGNGAAAVEALSTLTGLTPAQSQVATAHFARLLSNDGRYEGMFLSLRAQVYAHGVGATILVRHLLGVPADRAATICSKLRETL